MLAFREQPCWQAIQIANKMLELSLYSHLFEHKKQKFIYNTTNNFFAQIPNELYDILLNKKLHVLEKEDVNTLISKGILIDSANKYDYYNEEKIRFLASTYDRENLGLVLVPSTACNFACPYCFEEKKNPKIISEEVEKEIIKFIKSHKTAKTISLTWYGGEPLLAFKQIKRIYQNICNIKGKQIIDHSIITNGYLINEEIIEFFKSSRISTIQITLDGKEKRHNSTRFLKEDKSGTYNRIKENIIKTAKNLPTCRISVRVNINKENMQDFVSLNQELNSLRLENLNCYPGIIRESTPDQKHMSNRCINGDELGKFLNSLKEKGCDHGIYPTTGTKGCMMNRLNSYIIGPEGEVYKCWNDVSNEEKIVGNIMQKELINKTLFYRYLNDTTPFSDTKCKDCKLFPVCSGGCGHYRYKNLYEDGCFNICHEYQDIRDLETALVNSIKS